MAMRHLITSKRRSSSVSRMSNLSLGSANVSSRYTPHVDMEATSSNSQTGSSPSVTSNTVQTSISPTTTELNQNHMAMRQPITSKRRLSSSSRTSNLSLGFTNFSSRSTHSLDMEATNSNSQTGSFPSVNPFEQPDRISKIFGQNVEDLEKAGIVVKAKTAEEFEIGKAKDYNMLFEMYCHVIFYPAKLRNPKMTNSWAIAHPDAPEIKELGIDGGMIQFLSQLEKSKDVKGMPMNLILVNPVLFDIDDQITYMKMLVASLE